MTIEAFGPRSRTGLRRPDRHTQRFSVGRLIRISREAACGFLRAQSGGVVYFLLADLAGGEAAALAVRPGARLRYRLAAQGVPRAEAVSIY